MMKLYTRRIWINRIGITLSMVAMSLGLIALLCIFCGRCFQKALPP